MNFRKMLWLFIAFSTTITMSHCMKRQSRRISQRFLSSTFAPTMQKMYKRNYTSLLRISSNITAASTLDELSEDYSFFEQSPTGCDIIGWTDDEEEPFTEKAIQKITGDKNQDRIAAYANLMKNFMRNEEKYGDKYITLYHGMENQSATATLLRTIIAQHQQRKCYNNFLLLRDISDCESARGIEDATEWAMSEWNKDFNSRPFADILYKYKFDHDDNRSKILLSTNLSPLAHADEQFQEDSWRFIYNTGIENHDDSTTLSGLWLIRNAILFALWSPILAPFKIIELIGDKFSHSKKPQNIIKNTLTNAGFDEQLYDDYEADFEKIATAIEGAMLQIFIPRNIAQKCIYTSGPIGKPLKSFTEEKSYKWNDIDSLTKQFKKLRIEGRFFADPEMLSIYYPRYAVQTRALLNPEFFENPKSGIKMKMYCAADEEAMNRAIEGLHEIARKLTKSILK